MSEVAQRWLNDQRAQQRELLLIVDRLAEPDPIAGLFDADLMQDYVNLYQGTEFDDLADVGPWLVRLTDTHAAFIQTLLQATQQHWGWLASAERIDLAVLAEHWRERMLINEDGQRSLYRFQDNRVIAHHLGTLAEHQRPLLLGPLTSALCWSGQLWQQIDNPHPGLYPLPFEAAWLEITEPEAVTHQVLRHNFELWLWQNHCAATAQLAETQPLKIWLDQQLEAAKDWGWQSDEQVQFLLLHRLDPTLASHPAWVPQDKEEPDAHFTRSSQVLLSANTAVRSDQG
jgi:hypothetical protein